MNAAWMVDVQIGDKAKQIVYCGTLDGVSRTIEAVAKDQPYVIRAVTLVSEDYVLDRT